MLELLFLRAICNHALGLVRDAVRDYDACLTWSRPPGSTGTNRTLPEETRAFQFLAFYQKEVNMDEGGGGGSAGDACLPHRALATRWRCGR